MKLSGETDAPVLFDKLALVRGRSAAAVSDTCQYRIIDAFASRTFGRTRQTGST